MTTLQSFQSEIDKINKRELELRRAQIALDKEKEAKEKESKGSGAAKTKGDGQAKPVVDTAKAIATPGNGAATADTVSTSPTVEKLTEVDNDRAATAQQEEAEIMVRAMYLDHAYDLTVLNHILFVEPTSIF
jgi:outer membrane lipopolysaccharide assembly protein LptE/RlpB